MSPARFRCAKQLVVLFDEEKYCNKIDYYMSRVVGALLRREKNRGKRECGDVTSGR
jgi:hypothetical protein